MTYRTLREARVLRDNSNQTLRWNRSLKEAGIHRIDDDSPTPGALAGILVAALISVAFWAIVAALLVLL